MDQGGEVVRPKVAGGRAGDPFAPIADFGFLSDCETTALVAPSGNIEWMCLPRMDSPSVFGSMLDRDAGYFRVGPAGVEVPAAQRYIPGTIVMETTWWTPGGWLVVTDALLMGPWHHETERSHTHRRAPTDYDADHVLLRMVRCVNGQVQVRLDCMPVFDYGRAPARWEHTGDGLPRGASRAATASTLRLTTDMNVGFEGSLATARTLLKQGETRFVALSWSEHAPPHDLRGGARAAASGRSTTGSTGWTAARFPDHPWRSHLQRSALTLKGLTFAPTGAVAAAATTSLPETPGRRPQLGLPLHLDPRLDDGAVGASTRSGFDWEANDFFYFIADVAEAAEGHLQIMYGSTAARSSTSQRSTTSRGYDGARPVRIGNGAYMQEQHDVWGAISAPSTCTSATRDRLDDRLWTIIVKQVEAALAHWRDPTTACGRCAASRSTSPPRRSSAGWPPTAARASPSSAATASGRELAGGRRRDPRRHPGERVDERGVFIQHYGTKALDASVLLIPLLGFLPPTTSGSARRCSRSPTSSPRTTSSSATAPTRPTTGSTARRARSRSARSGWSRRCADRRAGPRRALCEKLLSLRQPLQLYAEEIDAHSGRHLGNFPQAFTHLALINAVMHVIRAENGEPQTTLA